MARIVKDPKERRNELIKTAQHLFYTKGYQNTSVSDIVKTVGVAQGTFYYYFSSKQEILEAIITEITTQAQAILHKIVIDDTLDAIAKWTQAYKILGNWKLEHKKELLEISRLIGQDENILLKHKLDTESRQMAVNEFTKIIAQGVEEGVFTTPFIEESAEMVIAIGQPFRKAIRDIVRNPTKYNNPLAIVQHKFTAIQTAIERILGATPGSLPIIDQTILEAWFNNEQDEAVN